MSVLEQNCTYLEKNHPEWLKVYQDKMTCLPFNDDSVQMCLNKAGQKNIVIREKGDERYIHSQYNAMVEAERWAVGTNQNAGLIIVIGLGLGYHITALQRLLPKTTEIIVIEPDIRIFSRFLENVPIDEVFSTPDMYLLLSDEAKAIAPFVLDVYKKKIFISTDFRIFSIYENWYNDLYRNIMSEYSDVMNMLTINLHTSEYFKELWIKNYLKNIKKLNGAYNGKDMENIFHGIPALLVSAGPSLDKNMEQIRELNGKCVVFAGGSAYRILKKNNIHAHFAVVIDGSPLIMNIYCDSDSSGTSLIYLNRCYYELLEKYSEDRIVFIDTFDKHTKRFGDGIHLPLHQVLPDATVAGVTVEVAAFMGCNPIILVGQDFAYTNLKLHAEGAAHNYRLEGTEIKEKQLVKAIDIYGQETYTAKNFLASKRAMEAKVAIAIANGHQFFNASEGGIGVELCKVRKLSEVKNEYLQQTHGIDAIISTFIRQGNGQIHITKEIYKEYYDKILLESHNLGTLAKQLHNESVKMNRILEKRHFRDGKHIVLAKRINMLQEELEKNQFYLDYVVGTIEQTIAIHKVIMNHELTLNQESIKQNISRIIFITKQCVETMAVCNFFSSLVEDIQKNQTSTDD